MKYLVLILLAGCATPQVECIDSNLGACSKDQLIVKVRLKQAVIESHEIVIKDLKQDLKSK